jgi:hypothetical protein
MSDYYEFKVTFSKGNTNIDAYVCIPATELSSDLLLDEVITNDDELTIIYWAQDMLLVDHHISIYPPNWDWEIAGLS